MKMAIRSIDDGKLSEDRRKVKVKGKWLDNRWVVPYCPFLSKRYKAHINVEICSSISAFKYLFKYVFKGGDRTTAVLENEVNEIQNYLDARYLSAPEAVWCIFSFKLHHRSPAIQQLQIHLLNQQTITFDNDTTSSHFYEMNVFARLH